MNFAKFQELVEKRGGFRTMESPMASGEYFSDSCGDMYTYYLKVGPGDVIEDVSYFTTGCGFGTATCSIVVDLALGKTLDEAYAITDADIEAQLDGYPDKKKDYPERSRLALQAAIDDFRKKRAAGTITDEMLAQVAHASARIATLPGNGRTSQDELADVPSEAVPAASDDDKVLIKLH
ncbi:MAG: iron-sulfur cluster assembly scaffold protein [Candidatus Eremiobacteraeota bacterium]|nr:iron-sulfur cluster assembly scaffold protein [Candidatus Eremiobacteraeota bacterium]MBC5803822.1 iron-sulfur cluster assembly scaffold protein [Candidatus Eremiobacteraeota bacterium]MBC5822412.1 iron-sulfur cluster assembly scaffold protein [Candidatus Eremiobacteraeota bacterium]